MDWISHPGNSLNLIINGWGDCSQPCPRMAKGKMVDLVLSHISGMGGFFCFFVFFPHLRFSVFFCPGLVHSTKSFSKRNIFLVQLKGFNRRSM